MDTTTFLWTLAATLFAGIQLFLQKIVAHERRDAAFSGMMMYGISGVLAFGILIFYPWPSQWLVIGAFGLGAGTVHSFGNYLRIQSLKNIDSVIYFPLNKLLGPLIVVIGGLAFFHDPLTVREYIGIALSLTVPLFLLSAAENHRQRNLRYGLILLVVSTALTSASPIFSKAGLAYAPAVLFMVAVSQVAGTFWSTLILFRQKGLANMVAHIERRDMWLGLWIGLIGFVSYFTLLKALSTGLISIVYVIQAHYILIPIALSVWWYREHINTRKVVAIIVSLLAIGILYQV